MILFLRASSCSVFLPAAASVCNLAICASETPALRSNFSTNESIIRIVYICRLPNTAYGFHSMPNSSSLYKKAEAVLLLVASRLSAWQTLPQLVKDQPLHVGDARIGNHDGRHNISI